MKKLIWLVILGLIGYAAYSKLVRPASEEVSQVRELEREYRRGTNRFISSMRSAGEPGLVILADPETAIRMLRNIRRRLQELMGRLTEEEAIVRAQALENEILTFFRLHEIE